LIFGTPVANFQSVVTAFPVDHIAPVESYSPAEPIEPVAPAATRTPAEEARTLVAQGQMAALATSSEDGTPWASAVLYAALADGTPILCLSTLAEHGRNLTREPRASLMIGEPAPLGDPLDSGRVTLAGRAEALTEGPERDAAVEAYRTASPSSSLYGGFGDFTYYALRVDRVRWVGGFGRMDSTDAGSYHAAEPDPVASGAAYAIKHLNEDHAHNLLDMARVLGGHPDATEAKCVRIDRYGLDLNLQTPRGFATTRIAFAEPANKPGDLRGATVELARRARGE
jgi:putative heme iron utilization protein